MLLLGAWGRCLAGGQQSFAMTRSILWAPAAPGVWAGDPWGAVPVATAPRRSGPPIRCAPRRGGFPWQGRSGRTCSRPTLTLRRGLLGPSSPRAWSAGPPVSQQPGIVGSENHSSISSLEDAFGAKLASLSSDLGVPLLTCILA